MIGENHMKILRVNEPYFLPKNPNIPKFFTAGSNRNKEEPRNSNKELLFIYIFKKEIRKLLFVGIHGKSGSHPNN